MLANKFWKRASTERHCQLEIVHTLIDIREDFLIILLGSPFTLYLGFIGPYSRKGKNFSPPLFQE